MKRFIRLTLLVLIISAASFAMAFADQLADPLVSMKVSGFSNNNVFTDDKWSTYAQARDGNTVTLSAVEGVSCFYIEFDKVPQSTYTVTDPATGRTAECGENHFLHEYQDLIAIFGSAPKEVVLSFAKDTVICELYGFSGPAPDWVQKWEPYLEKADLMLITTHSDDEQLFFAGLLPYYSMERKLNVQVVYFIQHFHKANKVFDHTRPHEQLNGLWTVGIRNYPYISEFPDVYGEGENRQDAMSRILSSFRYYGYSYDDFQKYVVDVIRRFRPLVVVTHDLDGEYGHAAHILNADVTTKAMDLVGDESKYPESASEYGTWVPNKLYVHLYNKNQIVMDWDTPYESMGGKTPLQMTQAGFQCHASQHRYWFWSWLNGPRYGSITKASSITKYSPCKYGLYFSTVGEDVEKNDMFENVVTYAEQEAARKAEEEAAAAAKKAAEEEELIQKRYAEADALRLEEAEKIRAAAQLEKSRSTRNLIIAAAILIVIIALIIFVITKQKSKK